MKGRRPPVLTLVGWVVAAGLAQAQPGPAGSPPQRAASGAEIEQLSRQFREQEQLARRRGDPAALQRLLRQAMERLPQQPRWPNELAWQMLDAGRATEALALWDRALALPNPPLVALQFEANRLAALIALRRDEAASVLVELRRRSEQALAEFPEGLNHVRALRVQGALAMREADQHERALRLHEHLAARAEAQRLFAQAWEAARVLGPPAREQQGFSADGLASAQRTRAIALTRLQRFGEAEQVLAEHLRFVEQESLPPAYRAGALHALAVLRLWQTDYADAERQLRQALALIESQGFAPGHPFYVGKQRDLLLVLWARGQVAQALRELTAFDTRAVGSGADPARLRMSFERGLVYLSSGRSREAEPLFAAAARFNRDLYGPGHFYTAQATGLQAVAQLQNPAASEPQRRQASDLLRAAVLDMLLPANADFLNDVSVRRPVRELILRAYLEAMAERGGLPALVAMGVADRLLAGSAGQAMADAALRAAANDPTLAAAVRQEQDLRRQLQALQEALQADDLDAASAQPLRRRAAELGLQRQQVQETIRALNPRFDRLLNPGLVNPTDVSQRLTRDEVLLLAMPTARHLYLWAVSADELPVFVRVDLGQPRLAELVQRLRRTLDFGQTRGRVVPFDLEAARELHRQLIDPVAPVLKGKRHLIVATQGPLAQLPWSLLAAPAAAGSAEPAWLVRQLALSQVPTVASWLALRQTPPGRQASEALIAWADPAYALSPRAAVKGRATSRDLPLDGRGSAARLRYEDLPALPETRDEVLAIAAALKASPERDLRVGAQATRDSVMAASRSGELARKRVIVFATHGLMAGDLPGLDQPALALASTAGQRDALAALIGLDDILGLKLNADWVVLSACNTAAADGKAEESLSGLARGFLYAGSRSLLVTHWAVETDSAKLLTTATFEHQASNPQASKAESLRQSMLKLMTQPKHSHPAFWAPYVLVGDGAR